MTPDRFRAVVLLSGGLDSATTLAMARAAGRDCHCLTVDYGQRHRVEVAAAARVAESLGAAEQRVFTIDLAQFGGSALTDPAIAVPQVPGPGIPITYVPARNTVFLSLALAWAEVLGAQEVWFGANAVDYSGYPDCRPEYMRAFETLANLATKAGVEGQRLELRTPIIDLTKAEIIRRGVALGVDYGITVSCYQPDATAAACGMCDACRLRRAGFEAAGIPDPTPYASRP